MGKDSKTWKAKCTDEGYGGYWNLGDIITIEDNTFKVITDCNGNINMLKTEILKGDRIVGIKDLNFKIAGEWEIITDEIETSVSDNINPAHYNSTKISAFNVIDDWGLNFYTGNVVKYIQRAGKKENNSELQDLKKAQRYLEKQIELLEVGKML